MKKILLTFICGFGLLVGFAQEPSKVAKKNAAKAKLKNATQAPKLSVKEKQAIIDGKAKSSAAVKVSKAEDRAN